MNVIAPTDFIFIKEALRRETAIVLDAGKEYLVESRLLPIVRAEKLENLEELCALLRKDAKHALWRTVFDALTTNETSFFRDIEPFEILKSVVIPSLIEKRKASKRLRFWSAACSSGQEPYSLAMLIKDSFPQLASWDVRIIATDFCTDILTRAKSGSFLQHEVNRGLPAIYLVKYFEKKGSQWAIKNELKQLIQFSELNLTKPFNSIGTVDVVLIRNVLIYFDVETKRQILKKIKGVLSADGYLFLGSAETTLGIENSFKRIPEQKGSCFCVVP
jgi:chemotaxis protein methyltransferase CheR